jgi:hypothetical protein
LKGAADELSSIRSGSCAAPACLPRRRTPHLKRTNAQHEPQHTISKRAAARHAQTQGTHAWLSPSCVSCSHRWSCRLSKSIGSWRRRRRWSRKHGCVKATRYTLVPRVPKLDMGLADRLPQSEPCEGWKLSAETVRSATNAASAATSDFSRCSKKKRLMSASFSRPST